jgi:hypothetical protein
MIYMEPHGLRDSFRFRRSEWGLACILAFGWGVIPLVVPGNSFDSPSLAWLSNALGETIMALGAIIVGGVRVTTLYVNGRWWRCSQARMVTAFLSMLIWVSIFYSIYRSGTSSPGLVAYLVFLIMDGHTIYEAARDARFVDEKRRAAGE